MRSGSGLRRGISLVGGVKVESNVGEWKLQNHPGCLPTAKLQTVLELQTAPKLGVE